MVKGFRKHEYLHQVKIETDKEHQKRVILKAMVDPDVMDLPPYVEVTDRNSVVVNYYRSQNRNLTQPPDLPVTQSPSEVPRSVFTPDKLETEFEKKIHAGTSYDQGGTAAAEHESQNQYIF